MTSAIHIDNGDYSKKAEHAGELSKAIQDIMQVGSDREVTIKALSVLESAMSMHNSIMNCNFTVKEVKE